MRPLSPLQILQVWDIGQSQHPLDRALTLLSMALPDRSIDELACLTIGQRDAYLLTLRELTLGSRLEGFAECPQCREPLEFMLNVADVRVADLETPPEQTIALDGYEVRFGLPTSQDLGAIAHHRDLDIAHQQLTQRCLRDVRRDGVPISPTELPTEVMAQLSAKMTDCDPQAEILFDLICPACRYAWQVLFDIVSFFWTELSAQAKRLLRDIHHLARSYGWREADILAMSSTRRQAYLDLVMA